MSPRRAFATLLVVLALFGAVAACGSSSKSDDSSAAPSGSDSGACPFSGSTTPQEVSGEPAPATLTDATPQTDGCIDNVALRFSPALASAKFAYESGAPVLVVTIMNTQLGGGLSTGTIESPKDLNHVQKVDVTSSAGDLKVSITLDEKRPYLVSSSQVPAEIQLSIG